MQKCQPCRPPAHAVVRADFDDVLRDYFADIGVPVLAHFPVGHVRYNATLPIGALVELDATAQTLRVLENPVTR